MEKWNPLKHGCWDVLLCCCGNTYGIRGLDGGGGRIILQEPEGNLCACVFQCFARLCTAGATRSRCIQSAFFSLFFLPPLEFKGSGPLKWWAPAQAFWHKHPCMKNGALMDRSCLCVRVGDWISLHSKYSDPLLSRTAPFSVLSAQHWLQLITVIHN